MRYSNWAVLKDWAATKIARHCGVYQEIVALAQNTSVTLAALQQQVSSETIPHRSDQIA
jgi:hypothetical protein